MALPPKKSAGYRVAKLKKKSKDIYDIVEDIYIYHGRGGLTRLLSIMDVIKEIKIKEHVEENKR